MESNLSPHYTLEPRQTWSHKMVRSTTWWWHPHSLQPQFSSIRGLAVLVGPQILNALFWNRWSFLKLSKSAHAKCPTFSFTVFSAAWPSELKSSDNSFTLQISVWPIFKDLCPNHCQPLQYYLCHLHEAIRHKIFQTLLLGRIFWRIWCAFCCTYLTNGILLPRQDPDQGQSLTSWPSYCTWPAQKP